MGHAGAWTAPGEPGARAKYQALERVGVTMVNHPEKFGNGMKALLSRRQSTLVRCWYPYSYKTGKLTKTVQPQQRQPKTWDPYLETNHQHQAQVRTSPTQATSNPLPLHKLFTSSPHAHDQVHPCPQNTPRRRPPGLRKRLLALANRRPEHSIPVLRHLPNTGLRALAVSPIPLSIRGDPSLLARSRGYRI